MKKKELRQRIADLESEVRFLRLANRKQRDIIRELGRTDPFKVDPGIKAWPIVQHVSSTVDGEPRY